MFMLVGSWDVAILYVLMWGIVMEWPCLNNLLTIPPTSQGLNIVSARKLLIKESNVMDEITRKGVEDIEVEYGCAS
jgi:hypothetical protein